jgi:hypothetical protein
METRRKVVRGSSPADEARSAVEEGRQLVATYAFGYVEAATYPGEGLMSATSRVTVAVVFTASILLSGCMGLYMSDEQTSQACDSYRNMLGSPSITAQQRGQIISGMRQMGCSNVPSQ